MNFKGEERPMENYYLMEKCRKTLLRKLSGMNVLCEIDMDDTNVSDNEFSDKKVGLIKDESIQYNKTSILTDN
jgi:hypothetical protein